MENICLIMVHFDANPSELEAKARELYSPRFETCYICISDRFDLFQRSSILRKFRKVFTNITLDVKPVPDKSIYRLHKFICWHQSLTSEIANRLNIVGRVLYRLWQIRKGLPTNV